MDLFIVLGRVSVEKKDLISLDIAGPKVSQLVWKKLAEKPSGLGALSECIENIASFTSSSLGVAVSLSLSSLDMQSKCLFHHI